MKERFYIKGMVWYVTVRSTFGFGSIPPNNRGFHSNKKDPVRNQNVDKDINVRTYVWFIHEHSLCFIFKHRYERT